MRYQIILIIITRVLLCDHIKKTSIEIKNLITLRDGEFLTEEQILEIIVASRRATSTMRYREKKKESAAAATSNTLPTDTLPTA